MLAGSVSVLSKYIGVVSSPLRFTAVALALLILPGCGSSGSDGGGLQGTNTLERSIEGTVLDVDGTPKANVQISVLETGNVATTDVNGHYALLVEAEAGAELSLLVESGNIAETVIIDAAAPLKITINIQVNPDRTISATISEQVDKRDSEIGDPVKSTPEESVETPADAGSVESDSGSSVRPVRRALCRLRFNKETMRRELICRRPPTTNSGEGESSTESGGGESSNGDTPANGGGTIEEAPTPNLVPGFTGGSEGTQDGGGFEGSDSKDEATSDEASDSDKPSSGSSSGAIENVAPAGSGDTSSIGAF